LLTGGNERYSDESTAQSELVGIVLAGAIAEHQTLHAAFLRARDAGSSRHVERG